MFFAPVTTDPELARSHRGVFPALAGTPVSPSQGSVSYRGQERSICDHSSAVALWGGDDGRGCGSCSCECVTRTGTPESIAAALFGAFRFRAEKHASGA